MTTRTASASSPSATFLYNGTPDASDLKSIKIDGANYAAFDTGDGYVTVRDVVICGEIPKGVKDAPKDYKAAELQEFVNRAQALYQQGKYVSPAHKGHNGKLLEVADPEFLGFVLPKRVGRALIEAREQDAIYADVKLKASAFARALQGELPYISPEIIWESNEISSIAFLDSKPPHFKAPLFTVQPPVKDESARFEAVLQKVAAFAEDEKKGAKPEGKEKPEAPEEGGDEKKAPFEAKEGKEEAPEASKAAPKDDGAFSGKCCAHCAAYGETITRMARLMGIQHGDNMQNQDAIEKPAGPVEQPAPNAPAKMEAIADPKMAAKFAAQEDRIAALEAKEREREAEAKAKALAEKALFELRGYQIGEKAKAEIARSAREGEARLNDVVATLKEVCAKDPPKGLFEATDAGVAATSPVLAKFQAKGPDALAAAQKALEEWHAIKAASKGFTVSAEDHLNIRVPEILGKRS